MKHDDALKNGAESPGADDPRLTAWVLGELPPEQAATIAAAVAADPELAAVAAELRALTAELGTAYHSELSGAPPAAEAATEPLPMAAARAPILGQIPWALPLAASLTLVGMIGGVLWWQGEMDPAATPVARVIADPAPEVPAGRAGVAVTEGVELDAPVSELARRSPPPPAPAAHDDVRVVTGSNVRSESEAERSLPVTVLEFSDFEAADVTTSRSTRDRLGGAGVSPLPREPQWVGISSSAQIREAEFGWSSGSPVALPVPANLDAFDRTELARFRPTLVERFATLGLDADTASWNLIRRILREGRRVPRDAVRVEELVNAFPTSDRSPAPGDEHPGRWPRRGLRSGCSSGWRCGRRTSCPRRPRA